MTYGFIGEEEELLFVTVGLITVNYKIKKIFIL